MRCTVHALCRLCVTESRVGTHQSGALYPRDALSKGHNIQELSVRDTSTLHPIFLGGGGEWDHLLYKNRTSKALVTLVAKCTYKRNTNHMHIPLTGSVRLFSSLSPFRWVEYYVSNFTCRISLTNQLTTALLAGVLRHVLDPPPQPWPGVDRASTMTRTAIKPGGIENSFKILNLFTMSFSLRQNNVSIW